MIDTHLFHNQPYDKEAAEELGYLLIQKDPVAISWVIKKIIQLKARNISYVYLKKIIPASIYDVPRFEKSSEFEINTIKYYSIIRNLVQLLLWTRDSPFKPFDDIRNDDYKIHLEEIPNENIYFVQILIYNYSNHLAPEEFSSTIEDIGSIEVIEMNKEEKIQPINSNNFMSESLNKQVLKDMLSEIISDNLKKYQNKSFKLPFSYKGEDNEIAEIFLKVYDNSATRDGWTDKGKLDYLPDHLGGEAFKWYFNRFLKPDKDWECLKREFRKYWRNCDEFYYQVQNYTSYLSIKRIE